MLSTYQNFVWGILGIVWSDYLVYLLIAAGVYFTVRSKFAQVRLFPHMIKLLKASASKSEETGISSLKAFLLAVGGRVGTGNIAGVAAAICAGGPGAVFWMWIVGIFGAGSAFVESTLAQIYKEKKGDEFVGGPAYYAEKGLNLKWYGKVLAVVIVTSCLLGSPGIQANTIASTMNTAFNIPYVVTGAVLVVALGWVIFGGIKRIGNVSQKMVPIMCALYVIIGLFVLVLNINRIPAMFSLIVSSALNAEAAFGGIIGSALAQGVRRGVYSNEAGLGSGAPAAAAADVKHPVAQGLIQACSIYIDTLLICTITAFIILLTDCYNVVGADGAMMVENLAGIDAGAGYVQMAIDQYIPLGKVIVAVIMTFFAFTSLYGYYYQAESSFSYIIRNFSEGMKKTTVVALRLVLLTSAMVGCLFTAQLAWDTADIFGGMMAWGNIVVILIIGGPAFVALKDYDKQRAAGIEEPVFHPAELGIKNAELWDEVINAETASK